MSAGRGGQQQQQQQQLPPPFWKNPSFCAEFCDPFIEGSSLQNNHVVMGLQAIVEAGDRLVAQNKGPVMQMNMALDVIKDCLRAAYGISDAVMQAERSDKLDPIEKALGDFVMTRLCGPRAGGLVMVPCGWQSKKDVGTVMLLVERGFEQGSEGSVVVCNSGVNGLDYHPRICSAGGKVKYKTCMKLNKIPYAKLTDPAFWTVTQTLWAKDGSEYHREEVLYDVLLPWLVEPRTVDEALQETYQADTFGKYRTARRSETSALGSCLEALYYMLAKYGVSDVDVARLRFSLYDEFLRMAMQPLACLCVSKNIVDGPTLTNIREMNLDKDPRGGQYDQNYGIDVMPEEITPTDVWILDHGIKVFGTKAAKEHDKQRLSDESLTAAYKFTNVCNAIIEAVKLERPSKGLTKAGNNIPGALPADQHDRSLSRFSFPLAGLLEFVDTNKYAGSLQIPQRTLTADFLSLPRVVRTAIDAENVFKGCTTVCRNLMQLSQESSISSRLALQYEGNELINHVFLELMPLPSPADGSGDYECEWLQDSELGLERRMSILESLYAIAHLYATMWQSIEHPTREFDSQRALVAGCIVCHCDAILRTSLTSEEPVPLGTLLWEDEGYSISTTVCRDNRPYAVLSAQFELTRPNDQIVRDRVLAYMRGMESVCATPILEFHQTDKIEINKYSGTMRFLRNLLERFGYPIIPRNVYPVPTEMEALTNWLFSDESQLIAEHQEVRFLRDIVFLFKYLTTMETRSVALLRRRNQETDSWRLTFDEDEGSRFHRMRYAMRNSMAFEPISWEVVNFRGSEMHIADVSPRGFGGEELGFGESPVTKSPSDVTLLAPDINAVRITEDDIIHANSLPTFGGVLSREESEALLSFLTVDYTRIPLVLGFFAAHDRATYLFDAQLRTLLQSVLFEPRHWVPSFNALKQVEEVPLRKSDLQQREHVMDAMMDARIELETDASNPLGTDHGLLLNELLHSPEATLRPLHDIVAHVVRDLSNSSVYSNDAACVLAMVLFLVDADSYIIKAIHDKHEQVREQEANNEKLPEAERRPVDDRVTVVLQKYHKIYSELLQGTIEPLFDRWISEAESDGDIVTACVIHGYRALLWSNMQPNEVSIDAFSKMFGSLAYVRNWHGFGMGQNRSDLVWSSEETSAVGTAEERFCRFLQAYGIDTRKLSPNIIQNYVRSSATKPLFLHVGGQVVRCPHLMTRGITASEIAGRENKPEGEQHEGDEEGGKEEEEQVKIARVPPADVPESRLFRLLQNQRGPLVFWLESVAQQTLDDSLIACVRTALRDKHFSTDGWRRINTGRFFAERAEVTVDIQTGEILWRNNQLKPVPDSMAQFHDFETIFGREPLHCGLVSRSKHRMWVHIIGTDFDLQEWDPPNPRNQGLGAPVPITSEEDGLKVPFICSRCARVGGPCWKCPICTFVNCCKGGKSSEVCDMCQQPNPEAKKRNGESDSIENPPPIDQKRASFEGVQYTRELNLYQKEPHDQPTEKWVVDTLKPVIFALFPPQKPLPYPLLLPKTPLPEGATECHLIGCEDHDKDTATWREFIVYKRGGEQAVTYFEVYMLVSHGRRIWRSLMFTSNNLFSLHSMEPIATSTSSSIPSALLHAAGDMKKKRIVSGSLVILRLNLRSDTKEYYVPPRLLQGVVPDALLETYRFWQNESNGLIVGEALESNAQDSPANGTKIIIELRKNTAQASIMRCKDVLVSKSSSFFFRNALERSSSSILHFGAPTDENPNEELVAELKALGFSENACKLALSKNDMNIAMAASWLLDDNNSTEIVMADLAAAVDASKMVSKEKRKQDLLDEGYAPNSVAYALRLFDGDDTLARNWLDDPANREQIQRLDPEETPESPAKKIQRIVTSAVLEFPEDAPASAAAAAAAAASSEDSAAASDIPSLKDPSTVTLIDARNPDTFDLSTLMSRVEDMSHVLVWGHLKDNKEDSAAEADAESITVTFVELPRLKLRFFTTKNASGSRSRLGLSDHEGWFISERVNSKNIEENMSFFVSLLKSLPHSLVLENDAQQYCVLVPNHDPFCPVLIENPFSTALVFDRGSMLWKESMDMPFFMYTIHPSLTFLVGPTLSSRLYLALLQMLTHDYTAAFETIGSCTVDTEFTTDEKHVFQQFERTLRDRSPDAHACRLKLVLSVLYGRDRPEWETLPEVNGYLRKISHVSRACRLTIEEELDVLHSCKSANDEVRNCREFLLRQQQLEPGTSTEMYLKTPLMKIGGMPWMKMQAYSGAYISNHGKNVKMMRYEQPPGGRYAGVKFLEVLWDDHLMMDDMSGTTRNLGFCFLYQVLRNVTPISLCGRDITQSMGEILTRWFQLKHCRWGKDAVAEDGQTEVELLLELSLLCSMAGDRSRRGQGLEPVVPLDSLPAIPSDRMTMALLNNGIHFFGRQAKDTAVKAWFEAILAASRSSATSLAHVDSVTRCLAAQNAAQHSPLGLKSLVRVNLRERCQDRPSSGDTACSSRLLRFDPDVLDPALFAAYTSTPLSVLCGSDFIEWCEDSDAVSGEMPFSVDFHPAAKPNVAREMVSRMAEDLKLHGRESAVRKVPVMKGLNIKQVPTLVSEGLRGNLAMQKQAAELIDRLADALRDIERKETLEVASAARKIVADANFVDPSSSRILEKIKFNLRRAFGLECTASLDFITRLVISTTFNQDLMSVNPFLSGSAEDLAIAKQVCLMMLRTSRASQAKRALYQCGVLQKLLCSIPRLSHASSVTLGSQVQSLCDKINFTSSTLAELLTCRRYYMHPGEGESEAGALFDPRYLLFEYVFDIMLRERQVHIVEDFVRSCKTGESHVQQMIMGAGKTTVVGPLLSLILADGNSTVIQVMPTALLEQTRNIMRNCFSSIVKKQIFTLEFDRSVEDGTEAVAEKYAKLRTACKGRGIVCAAPETIKSLMLKFVEQSHAIESFDFSLLSMDSEEMRDARAMMRLRDTMIARSEMADALVKILDLWKKSILIMDEVDVLLHPLRSELNFPIGDKQAIDLAGFRWDLPIHLIDAVYHASAPSGSPRKRLICGPEQYSRLVAIGKQSAIAIDADEVLRGFESAIHRGYEAHVLQAVPHLVLLDPLFYEREMKELVAKWALLWLATQFVESDFKGGRAMTEVLLEYLMGRDCAAKKAVIEAALVPDSLKLLNLAQDWVCHLLPHVLSKIDRVSYGLLSSAELASADPRTPQSRLLMAIPFVGKDVPSRSSEFAHPDAVIGLTILAYRYEGLRKSDMQRLLMQLKQDYSRQVGPRDQRPASVTLANWLRLASVGDEVATGLAAGVLPLALLQPADKKQLMQVFTLLRKVPEVISYYLCQHVFPACMNFQKLKMSACGHELGSDILFGKRIGFSGTPSNLLPVDLGSCQYEPCSDGRILSVLTSPKVVTSTLKSRWDAKSLLRDICEANRRVSSSGRSSQNLLEGKPISSSECVPVGPVHALIDTGALITGMDNEEVADYLVRLLPEWMEGVVYLDKGDRQMVKLRSGTSVQLAQCGIPPEKRFTFYDQVHTTGMDIKQFSSARAVLTLGKDMTFRDYAQGAYRMRGIGRGMTIDLCIIPEVRTKIANELGDHATGRYEIDVPAWLMINSMRMETLQFVKMGNQELMNCWRKRALSSLLDEVHLSRTSKSSEMERLRRFVDDRKSPAEKAWLSKCVSLFREPVDYQIPSNVPVAIPYADRLKEIVVHHSAFTEGDDGVAKRVDVVVKHLTEAMEMQQQQLDKDHAGTTAGDARGMELNAEVVHEQEAQEEEEAEEEAEEEEQKMSQFSRDDEQQNPWPVSILDKVPAGELTDAFYRLALFHVKAEQPCMSFPNNMLVTDNFFRPTWIGLGQRRLKNAHVFMEMLPQAGSSIFNVQFIAFLKQLTTGCGDPNCSHRLCANTEAGRTLIGQAFGVSELSAEAIGNKAKMLLSNSTSWCADPHQCAMFFCPGTCATIENQLKLLLKQEVSERTRYCVALSLAEAETLRMMLHKGHPILSNSAIAVYDVNGLPLDSSANYMPQEKGEGVTATVVERMSSCLKFINCEMYYTDSELEQMERVLSSCSYAARIAFFNECLGVRNRERHLWGDTPIAKLFAPPSEWRKLSVRVLFEQARAAIVHAVKHKGIDPYAAFERFSVANAVQHEQHVQTAMTDKDPSTELSGISYEQFGRYFESMRLGFSPANCYDIARNIDEEHTGLVTMAQIASTLKLPSSAEVEAILHELAVRKQLREAARGVKAGYWACKVCTFVNSSDNAVCVVCDCDMTGHRGCPPDKWVCSPDKGGCTYFNPKTLFYCEMCGHARPDLSSVRLL